MARAVVTAATSWAAGPAEHELERAQVGGAAMLRHAASGVVFLPWYRGFRVERVYRYDDAGRNVSARYAAGPAALVSVYVFPSDRGSDGAVGATFEASVRDMLAGLAPPLWAHERGTAFASAAGEAVAGRRVEACGRVVDDPGPPRQVFVEAFEHGAWVLKFRATYRAELRADVEGFVCAWLAASGFGAPGALTRRRAAG
ncbi:MAG TPA: hypothetical protein VFS43_22875 [Polyangiaceae bacterium]|nr:hypothetical protein [Polyangiaceae bacterium]